MFLCSLSTFSQSKQFISVCAFWKKGSWPKSGESGDVPGPVLRSCGFTSDGVPWGTWCAKRARCTSKGRTPELGAVCAEQGTPGGARSLGE